MATFGRCWFVGMGNDSAGVKNASIHPIFAALIGGQVRNAAPLVASRNL